MKWNSLVLSLMLAGAANGARPPLAVAQSTQQNAEARKLFVEGRDLQDDGKYADAEKKFREALTKYPKADQSDRTAYYLIATLVKLGKAQDARAEIDSFRKNFPQSMWMSDVEEKNLTLGGSGYFIGQAGTGGVTPFVLSLPTLSANAAALQKQTLRLRTADGAVRSLLASPAGPTYAINVSPLNTSLQSEVLRLIIEKDADRGIENAKELLKADPSDPAVIANLSAIANSNSSQALPFLLNLMGSPTASPNARSQAAFWVSRRNGDKDQVARAFMEMLSNSKKDTDTAVLVDALNRLPAADRRAAFDQMAQSQNADSLAMLEKVYHSSTASVGLRGDVLQSVAKIMDPRALSFITDVAQNEKDSTLRRNAVVALGSRKDVDVKTLESILKSLPRTPETTTPLILSVPELPAPAPR